MKRYIIHLAIVTVIMLGVVIGLHQTATFGVLPVYLLPLTVVYFAIVCGVQYWLTMRSMSQSPRTFVQLFLSISIGVLILHLMVLLAGIFIDPAVGKRFVMGFLILYVVYTTFVITELVIGVKRIQNGEK